MAVRSRYARSLGARLRAARKQQGLSLRDVEENSHGLWSSVVVGSWERGDRAVTVEKLAGLAAFYGVPAAGLIPGGEPAGDGLCAPETTAAP